MNGPEIQHLIKNDLTRGVSRCGAPPHPDPVPVSPWVAMSLLQKATRRGRQDLARRAAATLLRDAPERLWRRLGCMASEDIGLGSLDIVGLPTAALAGKRLRVELRGEWTVASCVIGELARARDGLAPILLLDEIAAHLDVLRRAALFEEIHSLAAQAWMTGTDLSLFEGARCQVFEVREGVFHPQTADLSR